jgi:hypothetical protein
MEIFPVITPKWFALTLLMLTDDLTVRRRTRAGQRYRWQTPFSHPGAVIRVLGQLMACAYDWVREHERPFNPIAALWDFPTFTIWQLIRYVSQHQRHRRESPDFSAMLTDEREGALSQGKSRPRRSDEHVAFEIRRRQRRNRLLSLALLIR